MSLDITHGKQFERELSQAFNGLDRKYPVKFTRILDTAGAGNIVRAADTDFKLMVSSGQPGRPFVFHFECKATVRDIDFTGAFRSFVKPHQNAAMAMAERAGACGAYLFKHVNKNLIEVWNAHSVSLIYGLKRQRLGCGPAIVFPLEKLCQFAEQACNTPISLVEKIRATRRL